MRLPPAVLLVAVKREIRAFTDDRQRNSGGSLREGILVATIVSPSDHFDSIWGWHYFAAGLVCRTHSAPAPRLLP
jgi:hypothetical protein